MINIRESKYMHKARHNLPKQLNIMKNYAANPVIGEK